MCWQNIVGICMLASPFIFVLGASVKNDGWRLTAVMFGAWLICVAFVGGGIYLAAENWGC